MGLFKRKPRIENPEVIARINSRAVKYVATRDKNGSELVLGHNGSISVRNGEIIVYSQGRDVFRESVYKAQVGELLSRDGVRLTKTLENGEKYTVVAYYVYRR